MSVQIQTTLPVQQPLIINNNLCMSRKNKTSGFHQQCPYKKKIGDYCKIHTNASKIHRIDDDNDNNKNMKINALTNILPKINVPKINVPKIKIRKKTDSSLKKKKIIKIVRKNDPYTQEEFLKLNVESIIYNRLIATLNYYYININGDTEELFRLVREFFNTKWIDKRHITGLEELNADTDPIHIEENKNYIPPSLENVSGRGLKDRKICDNTSDFQDLTSIEEIPDVYYFSFEDNSGRVYGCDFRSFHQLVETSKSSMKHRHMNVPGKNNWQVENPYTREQITEKFLEMYKKKRQILFQNRISLEYPALKLDEETTLNLECLDVFQIIYKFGYPVDHQWFMDLNKNRLKEFYNKLEDIWNYRLQLTIEQKKSIVPNNDIFTQVEKHSVESGYDGNHPETIRKLKHLILNIIRKMVSEGSTKADYINGAIYVLTALVEVSADAANAMPGFVYVSGINDFD